MIKNKLETIKNFKNTNGYIHYRFYSCFVYPLFFLGIGCYAYFLVPADRTIIFSIMTFVAYLGLISLELDKFSKFLDKRETEINEDMCRVDRLYPKYEECEHAKMEQ